jgi:hypothetical protein
LDPSVHFLQVELTRHPTTCMMRTRSGRTCPTSACSRGALSSRAREQGDDRADVPDGDRAASARTSRASSSRPSCLRTARRRRARARPRGGRRRRGTPARGRRRGAQQQYTWRAECVRARSQGAASDDWRVAAAAPTRAAHAASAHRARSS